MTIQQTIDIPDSHILTIEVPPEVPAGRTILAFIPAPVQGEPPRTTAEALYLAAEQAADPNRKPISRLFGTHQGIFGGDGVAYQRAIRDEWD